MGEDCVTGRVSDSKNFVTSAALLSDILNFSNVVCSLLRPSVSAVSVTFGCRCLVQMLFLNEETLHMLILNGTARVSELVTWTWVQFLQLGNLPVQCMAMQGKGCVHCSC